MDWGQPYSCSSWAETFGQTFPILDDNNGSSIYSLFGVGYVPHNAVIGGDGQVIFSESGFNQNTMIDMIEEIAKVKLKRNFQLDKPKGVRGRSSDNTKIENEINWSPKINLKDGLEKTYKWIFDQIKSGSNMSKYTRSY